MKSLILLTLSTLFAGCFVSKVGIKLESDNSSVLKITAHSPTNSPDLGLDNKLKELKTRLQRENIFFGYQRTTETVTSPTGTPLQHYKYPIIARISDSQKSETFSAIVAEVMRISLDDFWYKVSPIENSNLEQKWHLSLSFKTQAFPSGASKTFKLSVKMPENITSYEPRYKHNNPRINERGKEITFDYNNIEPSQLYAFEVSAVKKQAIEAQQPIEEPKTVIDPPSSTSIIIQPAPVTNIHPPSEETWLDQNLTRAAALMTAITGLLGIWAAYHAHSKKRKVD